MNADDAAAHQTLYKGIAELLTMSPVGEEEEGEGGLGVLRDAAIACDAGGQVTWIGTWAESSEVKAVEVVDLGGAVVLPGLVDAHTHIVYAGDRTVDFGLRCSGISYEEVARRGGGIRLTVRETRAASREVLLESARLRLQDLVAHGVTTVEVKSGYGLSLEDELKILEVTASLAAEGLARVVPTVLPAHVMPDEFRSDRAGYLRMVEDELLPEVARRGLARFVDVFCDVGAFTYDECLAVLERGRSLGLGLKVHGEQLTRTGISAAAARLGAVSVDHLEHAADVDMEAMAEAGCTAVLLPGAALFLGGRHRAPARELIKHGVGVALSTDCNPGTCPSRNLPLMVTLGCTWLGLSPAEALRGVTIEAAKALGLDDGTGSLRPGGPCDLVVCDVPGWRHIPYGLGSNPVQAVWRLGRRVR